MRIIYFGSGRFGINCLNALVAGPHQLAAVFTQPARPAGRSRQPKPTDVADWCKDNGIVCRQAQDINSPETLEQLKQLNGQLLVVIAFGQKVSQSVIDLFPAGAINVHASLLPKYRGAAPIHWAIINGENETGVSIITLADRMDAGLILAQEKTPIYPEDDFQTIHDRLAAISAPLLLATINTAESGAAQYGLQDESQVSRAPKLNKKDGFIDFSLPAEQIVNKIRGLWPWPGAQAVYLCGKTGKSWRVTIAKAQAVKQPDRGPLLCGALDDMLNVICGRGNLKIEKLKPAGSGLMDFQAFVNGRSTGAGDLFLPHEALLRDWR